jgi:dihydropteroate synthase
MWEFSGQALSPTVVMGVVNVTPDSFSDGGLFSTAEAAIAHGRRLVDEGADIVDVGGESTRPGAADVSAAEEAARVVPVIEALSMDGVLVSVDTSKPAVAEAALAAGASIVNDVTGLRDDAMLHVVAASGCGVVIMHMQGTPRTMQLEPSYSDVVTEVHDYLRAQARRAVDAGVDPRAIAIDPGIGFGKTIEHNLALLSNLDVLTDSGFPVVLGTSRKSFLGTLTGRSVEDRDVATAATIALGVAAGVFCVRVHNVAAARDAVRVAEAIVRPVNID